MPDFKFLLLCLVFSLFTTSSCKLKKNSINNIAFKAQKDAILDKYPNIPNEEIILGMNNSLLYGDLKERYRKSLITLKAETDIDSVKLIVVILSPEVGKQISLANNFGIPYIIESCSQIGIECIDLSPAIADKDPTSLSLVPFDGNWSKEGAAFIADLFAKDIIDSNKDYRSSKTYPASSRPEAFGDLPPGQDEIVDNDKNVPYRLKANKQGLRMNTNVTFPKTKQTILFLGDSHIFEPYIDNEFITTNILQKKYPDKVIVNAAMINYTMEDYESLYREKAKYTEPDIVIVCTNGADILDYFFSARNRYSRLKQIYPPSEREKTYYKQVYESNR